MPDPSGNPSSLGPRFSKILTPIEIGGVTIPNRVARSAHVTRLSNGVMSDDLIAYHVERAKGGVGLTVLEIMAVHPSSPSGLNAFDDGIRDSYKRLIEQVRPHGMRLFQQLWHGGHNRLPLDGSPPWSSSDIPGAGVGVVPTPMTKAMIKEVVNGYASAARLCQDMGLDGVEVHGAHGYLIHQFLSPALNQREDEYGGSFENRVRFFIEIMSEIRRTLRPGPFAVGVRLAPDLAAGGVGVNEVIRVCQELETRKLMDYVSVSQGSYYAIDKMMGGMHEPSGYELPLSREVTRNVSVPRMVVGRVRTLEEADQIIRSGDADMVAMTRATIADPMLVKKSVAGDVEQVRPCIGCNQFCIGGLYTVGRLGCAVNPAAGNETRFGEHQLVAAESKRHVVVIGGGPAGMEAARVAALRGHCVDLYEAQPKLGGAIQLASRAPTRHGMADLTIWLEQEIYRLGVTVHLSTYVDADEIKTMAPDAVIVATGSMPRMDGVQMANPGQPMQGMDNPRLKSSWDVFSDPASLNGVRNAVIIDDLGHYEGVAVAEHLMASGIQVQYVTRHASFAPLTESALMTEPALRRLAKGDMQLYLRSFAIQLRDDKLQIRPIYVESSEAEQELTADLVVFVSANRSDRALYEDLKTSVQNVCVVGDANSPRHIQLAIREGHQAGATV